ncbi:MAG: Ig-like domain-containing protein, partial [Chloroflexi bacterium]|nr:Ig-like domain-containing protein [Chloroflexota bacterium]
MRRNRFALVAGVLALGVAACGDDVQVVEPTPPQPPPPPPVEATMAPASASVAVGNSVVFAVNASGGVAGEAASWTCSSSNTGIATVTSTSAGCSATGVAAGDVTITASVSKSGETVNVGAQLTVTSDEVVAPTQPGDPAFVVVASITGDNDTDVSGLQGRVSVTLNVERGDQDLEGLALLVDGEMVASQSFGSGMDMGMTPPDEAAEQAVHAFTMSFDSDGYDEHGDHVDVDYMNGEHTISAELEIGVTMADGMHGHETVSSNVVTVEFDNDDGYVVTADLGHNTALDDDGRVWYGGPDNGHVVISALGVSYSGAETGEAIVRLQGCEAEEDDEFDCKGEQADREISVISGGVVGMILNADDLPEANIDMEGPGAPNFVPNPNKREGGWVNASVGFTAEHGTAKAKANNWLEYGDEGEGVGGYTAQIRFAEAGSDKEVGGALAAPALPQLVLPPALAGQSSKANAFCVVASAVDKLGNESSLPKADEACAAHDEYATTTGTGDAAATTYAAGLLAGVDLQAPTIAFSPASPKANATSMKNFQVQLADEGSGIRDNDPLDAEVNLRDADDDDEIEDLVINISLPLATTAGLPDGIGYYSFTGSVTDKAGNVSEEAARTALHDPAGIMASTIVGNYNEKTGEYSMVATVTDDLSIKEY